MKRKNHLPALRATGAHNLKVWPDYMDALYDGSKTCEVRYDDRGYRVGDLLLLKEYDPTTGQYLGREIKAQVTHILRAGPPFNALRRGWCALSIQKLRHADYHFLLRQIGQSDPDTPNPPMPERAAEDT